MHDEANLLGHNAIPTPLSLQNVTEATEFPKFHGGRTAAWEDALGRRFSRVPAEVVRRLRVPQHAQLHYRWVHGWKVLEGGVVRNGLEDVLPGAAKEATHHRSAAAVPQLAPLTPPRQPDGIQKLQEAGASL